MLQRLGLANPPEQIVQNGFNEIEGAQRDPAIRGDPVAQILAKARPRSLRSCKTRRRRSMATAARCRSAAVFSAFVDLGLRRPWDFRRRFLAGGLSRHVLFLRVAGGEFWQFN
jgi:hypothetical protein